jgi:cell division protein FtsL
LSIIGILYLIQTAHVASLGYRLSDVQNERDKLAIENARLGYDIAKYESLDTIDQIATQKLGMAPLTKQQYLDVQAPAQAQLPPLPPTERAPVSIFRRVIDEIAGVGRAEAPAQGPPALPAPTPTGNGK